MAGGAATAGDASRTPAVLAVDGGASKTDVVIVDADGHLLGRARGGATNHQMVGLETAMANLRSTVSDAARAAGLELADGAPICQAGVYCLAGIDLEVDDRRVATEVRRLALTTHCDVRNDAFAVLRCGASAGWGIGVVCGTGLNCVGLGPDGTAVRFPALGELSGDFAPGGAWLGVRGLGLALRAGDGRGDATTLRVAVPRLFGRHDPEAVLEAVYTGDIPFGRLPELAEVVLSEAAAGDGAALDAARFLSREVVLMVSAAVARLGAGDRRVEIVTGGGLFEDELFRSMVEEGLRASLADVVLRRVEASPVLGAALLGLDALSRPGAAQATLRQALSTWSPSE